ncbi:IclR family transcriptional regulator [Puniceibacterium sp. IMCC21224]|uniref:IclR family transcriptional regulator n=1 Tax=Puniceibacterium sp. IMCC21224 TaxID=1618204 RepID=UPI00065CDC05|nr:helix-turn-helix domain-containing protein [Puniceibacterium sp. IMCC21224]KMK65512.1 transcriptional regulator, IclR family [Puniceibacterium sp. IMCC21224]
MPTVSSSLGEGTQSVLLTVAILERLARVDGPISISELAREIDASKSRLFRHLQTLAHSDFVAHDEASGGYAVGSRLLEICRTLNRRYDLLSIALPVLQDLRNQTGHTAILSRVDTVGVHVLTSLSSESPIVLEVRAGTVLPLDTSAQGRVALAFAPASRFTGNGPFSQAFKRLAKDNAGELDRILQQGWATAQMREGLMGKGAPVLDSSGTLVATLGLLDTATAMKSQDVQDTDHLKAAAKRFERELAQAKFAND